LFGYDVTMPTTDALPQTTPDYTLVRARAKVLAREDRQMKSDLIRLRQDAGLTQKQVAKLMGITQQAINKLERYDSDPKLSTLRRYANAVGALVAHEVVPDVGQSIWLAAAPRWEGAIAFSTHSARPSIGGTRANSTSNAWTGATKRDFALAG
jgi:transcriptional regulator with XRE-family HTH domain